MASCQEPPAEEVEKLYGDRFATLAKLEKAVILLPEKRTHLTELRDLRTKLQKTDALLGTCKGLIADRHKLRQQYDEVMLKSRKLTLLMLDQLENDHVPSPVAPTKHKIDIETSERPPLAINQMLNRLQVAETPTRMSLAEYAVSPFVNRIKPQKLEFLDFDTVKIKDADFQTIPRYMRNRETLPELQSFMDTIIIPCFTEKYQMVYRKRECIRHPADLEKWKLYQSQTSYFPGKRFITAGDLAQHLKRMVDKKINAKIQMLRHLQILKEDRKGAVTCYVWNRA